MDSQTLTSGFKIWGVDDVIYGPVDLQTLLEWVKDERVTASTWIFHHQRDCWQKANQVRELRPAFFPGVASSQPDSADTYSFVNLKPGTLRRVKILAEMNDQELHRFVQFMEVVSVHQFAEVVRQGMSGHAMYLILEGELRVRLLIGGKETILATLLPGEFFGEMSLFDGAPRSADVIANSDSILIKIDLDHFNHFIHAAPELGAKFMFAIAKTLVSRIRADNKRIKDSVAFARVTGYSTWE